MTDRLGQLARVIRSKNAGPFCLTIDLLFDHAADLERAAAAPALSPAAIAALYGVRAEEVHIVPHHASVALKVALRRPVPAGNLDDRDLYGAQQHIPLLDVEVP